MIEILEELHKSKVLVIEVDRASDEMQRGGIHAFRVHYQGYPFSFSGRVLKIVRTKTGDRIMIKKISKEDLN